MPVPSRVSCLWLVRRPSPTTRTDDLPVPSRVTPCLSVVARGVLGSSAPVLMDKPPFQSFARPRRLPQKGQRRLDARIMPEAPDRNALPHLHPPMSLDHLRNNTLQRDTVQRVTGRIGRRWHRRKEVNSISTQPGFRGRNWIPTDGHRLTRIITSAGPRGPAAHTANRDPARGTILCRSHPGSFGSIRG